MVSIRLDSDERRKGIVAASVPLFARKGFAGTTTKEIAEAAHISEALLFKHFPSKATLYREILRSGCEGDPALERLCTLSPSTGTLVRMIHFMVRHFLLAEEIEGDELSTRMRLVLNSFRDDGEYARLLFETVFERVHPYFAASADAAIEAGDLFPGPIASANGFWFSQHVAAMVAFSFLPGRPCVPYAGSRDSLVFEVSWFVLRGMGLREAAIVAALTELSEAEAPAPLRMAATPTRLRPIDPPPAIPEMAAPDLLPLP